MNARVQKPQLRNPPAKKGGGEGGVLPCPPTFVAFMILRYIQVSRFPQVQARGTGICQRRRELYSQTFDELIRQVGELNLGKKLQSKIAQLLRSSKSCIIFLVIAKR